MQRRIGPLATVGVRVGADRSILAGAGVAGALILAAVGAFIVAGGLLPFHAWPQLTGVSQTRPLTVTGGVVASRPVARVVLASPPRKPAPVVSHAAPVILPQPARPLGQTAPQSPYSSNEGSNNAPSPTPAPNTQQHQQSPPPQTPIEQIQQTVQQTAQQATTSLANTAEGTTAALGDTVSSVGTGVGNVVAGVSPALGQTVSGVGSAVGGTLTGVGRIVGGLLSRPG